VISKNAAIVVSGSVALAASRKTAPTKHSFGLPLQGVSG